MFHNIMLDLICLDSIFSRFIDTNFKIIYN